MAALNTNKLTVSIGGVERAAEVSRCTISNDATESDFVSFQSASEGGGRDWKLLLTAVQDPGDADSIWSLVWDSPGSEVAIIFRPYANSVPSLSQPHYTGTCVVTLPDGDILGGEADRSTSARWTVDLEWPFLAKPTKVTA